MGAGESKNLFQAAAKNEPERAKYFIEHNREDINGQDKVLAYHAALVPFSIGRARACIHVVESVRSSCSVSSDGRAAGWVDTTARGRLWGLNRDRHDALEQRRRPQDHREGVPLEAVLKLDAPPHPSAYWHTQQGCTAQRDAVCHLLATPVLQCMHHACCRLASQQPARWGSSG